MSRYDARRAGRAWGTAAGGAAWRTGLAALGQGAGRHRLASSALVLAALVGSAGPLAAQEANQGGGSTNILTPNGGLMVWTLVIFLILLFILSRYAFKPITAAVAAREKALEDAIEQARHDREEAAKRLTEQRELLGRAQGEAQRLIDDARNAGERVRQQLLEQTHAQQQDLLERARKEIDDERRRAIADLRREAVDLAILGAGKVIEKNLDDQTNRRLVDDFLGSLTSANAER